MTQYLILFAIVFGINLLPAFGPPTWSIIALYTLNSELKVPLLILVGAIAAACGRYVLGHCTRLLGTRFLPRRMRDNLDAAKQALQRRKRHAFLALGLFALSPVPSAQLFEAAGLTGVRLFPFTAAFFVGRIISYSVYAYTAKGIRSSSVGDEFRHSLTSPVGLGIQIVMIVLLVVLAQVDWKKRLGVEKRSGSKDPKKREKVAE
jgi:uncharacterized membrane protein YdjX (TVP38/TMEM64 family)